MTFMESIIAQYTRTYSFFHIAWAVRSGRRVFGIQNQKATSNRPKIG